MKIMHVQDGDMTHYSGSKVIESEILSQYLIG